MELKKEPQFFKSRTCCYAFSVALLNFFLFYPSSETITYLLYTSYDQADTTLIDITQLSATFMVGVGCVLGCFFIHRGRRRSLMLSAGAFSFFSFLYFLPIDSEIYHIIIRNILALIAGLFSYLIPYFIYEISPPTERGWLISFTVLTAALGRLYLCTIENFIIREPKWFKYEKIKSFEKISLAQDTASLKTLISFLIYFAPVFLPLLVIYLMYSVFPKQTPTFLLQQQRFPQIKATLSEVYCSSALQDKLDQLVTLQEWEERPGGGVWVQRRVILICFAIAALEQLCGFHAIQVNYNQQSQNYKIGMNAFAIYSSLCIFGGVIIFTTLLSKVPRKVLLIGGVLILTSCEASILCFSLSKRQDTGNYTFFVGCVFLFIYGLSLMPISWVIIPEMLDPKQGALACALIQVFSLIQGLVSLSTRNSRNLETLSYGTIIFCVLNLMGVMAIMLWMPETLNRSRNQIQGRVRRQSYDEQPLSHQQLSIASNP